MTTTPTRLTDRLATTDRFEGRGVDRATPGDWVGAAVVRAAARHPQVAEPDPLAGTAVRRPGQGREPVGELLQNASIQEKRAILCKPRIATGNDIFESVDWISDG